MANRSAIGARVRVVAGTTAQMREISAGGGYYSQDSPTAEFGMAWHTVADTVEVRWPSGTVRIFTSIPVDRHLVIDESGHFSVIGVEQSSEMPAAFRLHPCYPNPFNPLTTIRYDLPAAARVTLHIYDVSGRLVQVLRNGEVQDAGRNEVVWAGRDKRGVPVASGTYFYRLRTDTHEATGRMLLAK
jgi:hypothetical protein